jgi:hypothetical protein
MGSELVKPDHLDRKAVVYVRQSTPHQVISNQESLKLQYALDLRRSKRHADTVTFVEHPIGHLTTKPPPFLRVDALQILAASERCDLKRSSKKGMPRICSCRASKTVCRMSRVGPGNHHCAIILGNDVLLKVF